MSYVKESPNKAHAVSYTKVSLVLRLDGQHAISFSFHFFFLFFVLDQGLLLLSFKLRSCGDRQGICIYSWLAGYF